MTQTEHNTPAQSALPEHFDWIDGLRGVAAVAVVIFHYQHFYLRDADGRADLPPLQEFPWQSVFSLFYEYGSSAVQLFWVISGFVFAHVYLNRGTKFMHFIVARFARLYPLHFVTLLIVAGLQTASMSSMGHWQIYGNNNFRHFWLHLLMSSDWTDLSRGLSFNGPIWSVSLELVAYAVFLFALPLLRRLGLIAAVPITAFMWWMGLKYGPDVPGITNGVFLCAGYFFLGTCAYMVFGLTKGRRNLMVAAVAATCAVWLFSFWTGETDLAKATGYLSVVGVVALCDVFWRGRAIGGLKRLGNMSYSIYLIHVPLQMMVLLLDDVAFSGSRAFASSMLTLPIFLLVTLVLADVTYRYFELPTSRALRRTLSR